MKSKNLKRNLKKKYNIHTLPEVPNLDETVYVYLWDGRYEKVKFTTWKYRGYNDVWRETEPLFISLDFKFGWNLSMIAFWRYKIR